MKLQNIRKKFSIKSMAENLELKKWKTTPISLKKPFIEALLVVTEAGKSHLTNQKFLVVRFCNFPTFFIISFIHTSAEVLFSLSISKFVKSLC